MRLADALVGAGEAFLLLYLGPRLLGYRPGGRPYVAASLLLGAAVILTSEANRRFHWPLGTHNLVLLALTAALARSFLGVPPAAALAGSLACFAVMWAGSLALVGLTVAAGVDVGVILGHPALYLLGAVLERGFLLALALLVWRRGVLLFDATVAAPGRRGTLALLNAFLAQSYALVFFGVLSAATGTPLWQRLPVGIPGWIFWFLVTLLPVICLFLVRHLDHLHREELRAKENERLALLGRLTTTLAHEVRNPVTALRGYLEMGLSRLHRGDALPGEVATAFALGAPLVEHMENLLGDFLTLGRMAARREEPVPVDLGRVVREVAEARREMAAARGTELQVTVPETVPPLQAVPKRVQQLVDNLVKNALEAVNGEGRVEVRVETGPQGRELVLRVRDTGCGIPPEDLGRIFDAFYTTKEDGTGLGLMVVQQVASELGARVTVDSRVDRGTEFAVHFPLTRNP